MSFSNEWEESYAAGTHLSIWPWSDLVSLVYRHCADLIRERGKVLEFGCGAGANIPLFVHLGLDYHAVEGSSTIVDTLRQRYPQLAAKIAVGDFTRDQPHGDGFGVVVDRASLTHNDTDSIRRALALARRALRPGGLFLGVDWFSTRHSDYAGGQQDADTHTRSCYRSGQFTGVGRVHFSDEAHLRDLFADWKLELLEESQVRRSQPADGHIFSSWKVVARKVDY